ncbi:MAG: hypothetical protein KDK90_27225 [Leptospiraceae bacterium]|nr:hypothetical protein [Leptospiraceae bacterium]
MLREIIIPTILIIFFFSFPIFAGNTIAIAIFVSGEVKKGGWFGTKVKKGDIFTEGDTICYLGNYSHLKLLPT